MMGLLFGVEIHTVNHHLKQIVADGQLQADSVIRNFRITAADGKTYDTQDRLFESDFDRLIRQLPDKGSPP